MITQRSAVRADMVAGAALDDVLPGLDHTLDVEVLGLLADWQQRYLGRPHAERRRLLLLALEREQIVTIAYREDVLAERVDVLDVAPELRQLLRRALAWAWRDEALHMDWVRGQLRHEHRPAPVAVLFGHQLAGLVSGWVTTTRRHPVLGRHVAELVSHALIRVATAARQISPELAGELRVTSFRRYCLLNAALERTAERCWRRLAELAIGSERAEIERIADDEANHRAIFAAIAALFDDEDRLRAGVTPEDLVARLSEISTWFLPADHRSHAPTALGQGAPVHAAGHPRLERRDALREVVGATGFLEAVRASGGRVAIRTSFMMGYDTRDRSNVVDPGLLEELAERCLAAGAREVVVLDAPNVYDRYVHGRSVAEVAAHFGYTSPHYRVVDAEEDQVACSYPRGLGRRTISGTWLDAEHRVVLAKAVTDPVEFGHLGLCTLEGIGGRVDQTLYLGRFTDFRSAAMMAIDLAPPDLSVVDAWGPVADGPVGVMGSHRPCHPRRVYAGLDAIAVDLAVLQDMGGPAPARVPILAAASQWLGVDLTAPDVRGDAGPWGGGYRGPDSTAWHRLVCRLAYPIYTYGGSAGARFVPAFDDSAFPPRGPVRWDLRVSRALAQRVFGLHPPRPPAA